MTSLIAWIGIDSRGPASAYFASDSRITWTDAEVWDHSRKLFGCRRYPHIFGYCGDVLFPTQILGQVTEMIDSDLLVSPSTDAEAFVNSIVSILACAFESYPARAKRRFDVLHCWREGDGVPSRFHLRTITFDGLT